MAAIISDDWRQRLCSRQLLGNRRSPLSPKSSLATAWTHSYGTRSPLKNIRARGRIIFLFFPRAACARAENKTNQQCHLKNSRCRMELLDTDSCRGTVPMEPPMSNSPMRHQNPVGDFDDTGQILYGASCTIAAMQGASWGV